MRMSRIVIIAIAVFVTAISTSVWQGVPTHQVTATDQPSGVQLVSAESASEAVTLSANAVAGTDLRPTPSNPARKSKPREASCENPDVTTEESVSVEERNTFLHETMGKMPENATPAEKTAFIEAIKSAAPAKEFTRSVYVDDVEAVGDPPDPKDDPDGTKFEAWVEKSKEVGCKATPFRSSGGRLAAPTSALLSYTAGTKSCTNSHWTTNSAGGTLAKVTQTSKWYSDAKGLPSNPRRSYSTSAGWGWDEKGSPQGETGIVTVRYGVPLQYYNWTGQNFHFEYFNLELYTWYGEVEHWFGFSNKYGPRCSIVEWYP